MPCVCSAVGGLKRVPDALELEFRSCEQPRAGWDFWEAVNVLHSYSGCSRGSPQNSDGEWGGTLGHFQPTVYRTPRLLETGWSSSSSPDDRLKVL